MDAPVNEYKYRKTKILFLRFRRGAPLKCFETGGGLTSLEVAGADFKEFGTPITKDRFEARTLFVT